MGFAKFGNDLYTGERSIDFVGRRKIWYSIALVLVLASILIPIARGGFVLGIEFRGGSQFQITNIENAADDPIAVQDLATDTVNATVEDAAPRVSIVGGDGVRVQTSVLSTEESNQVRDALMEAYDVPAEEVNASRIGPSWGADVTGSAIRALVIFIVLAAAVMALYFRTWKMSVSAIVSLVHDLVITAGIYGILGIEVTPAAVIGLLTILGYSLYDTVVVFDKIRENTDEIGPDSKRTFPEAINLAVNQTLVRSINTSVVAALPVGAILFIGASALGASTLLDIALSLFIGILVATYSTIFIAAPLYSQMRENEIPPSQKPKDESATRTPVRAGSVR
jgi:preprotein translocase subunit SecF